VLSAISTSPLLITTKAYEVETGEEAKQQRELRKSNTPEKWRSWILNPDLSWLRNWYFFSAGIRIIQAQTAPKIS
jgi:hypothetical protein